MLLDSCCTCTTGSITDLHLIGATNPGVVKVCRMELLTPRAFAEPFMLHPRGFITGPQRWTTSQHNSLETRTCSHPRRSKGALPSFMPRSAATCSKLVQRLGAPVVPGTATSSCSTPVVWWDAESGAE